MSPTLASLAAALRGEGPSRWLSAIEAAGASRTVRDSLSRVIDHDRKLWSEHPDSLASGLLARTLGVAGLEGLREEWLAEVAAAGKPWVRALHPMPLAAGLLATLGSSGAVDLTGLSRLAFVDEDTVTVDALGKRERLRWTWRANETRFEPAPELVRTYPRFETRGGRAFMRVDAAQEPVQLPCPQDATAYAQLAWDGKTVIVYGSLDDFAGGFVWFVRERGGFLRPRRLEVERKLETRRFVGSVCESVDGSVIVANTSEGPVCWKGDACLSLPIHADEVALSPSGEHLAARTNQAIQVWRVTEAAGQPIGPRLPARFSPAGTRLVRGSTLYEATTGRPVAELEPRFGQYVEGGPAFPWFHVGDDLVMCSHSGVQLWRTADGVPVTVPPRMYFPHWKKLAHDRAGTRLAVLQQGERQVVLLALPSGQVEERVDFELSRPDALALSPSGRRVAVAQDADIEVRSSSGELILRVRHPISAGKRQWLRDGSLQFTDEDHLVSEIDGDARRLFRLAEGTSDPCGDPQRTPPVDWKLVVTSHTVLEHEPTGTRIVLPVSGDWIVHPTRRNLLACADAHVELCTPSDLVGTSSTDRE